MTDAPARVRSIRLDLIEEEALHSSNAGVMLQVEPADLLLMIDEIRAARAPVEAGVVTREDWAQAWERVCPDAARSARLGWFDGKNKREGFEAGYLAQSRVTPPADLTAEVEILKAMVDELRGQRDTAERLFADMELRHDALITELRASPAPVEPGAVTRGHRKIAASLVRESDGNQSLAVWVADGDVNEGNCSKCAGTNTFIDAAGHYRLCDEPACVEFLNRRASKPLPAPPKGSTP